MKSRQSAFVLAVSVMLFCTFSQAAEINIPTGGAIALQGLSASQRPKLQAGTAKLTWSNGQADPNLPGNPNNMGGSVHAGNVIGSRNTGTGHYEAFANDAFGDAIRVVESDEYPSQALVFDDATGYLRQLQLSGATQKIIGYLNGVTNGGTLNATNVRLDLVNGGVAMDLACQRLPTAANPPASASGMVVFTFDPSSVVGPTRLSPQDLLLNTASRNAALQAQGYTLGANGALQGVLLVKGLKITPAAIDFVKDQCFGFQTVVTDAIKGLNDIPGAWGQIQITTNMELPGNGGVSTVLGQAVSTPFNLPNGVPLRITHLASGSSSSIFPFSYDPAAPVMSDSGLLTWFNAFLVDPDVASGLPGFTGTTSTMRDLRFDNSNGYGLFRKAITARSTGSTVSFDTLTGELTKLGGFNQAWTGDFVPGVTAGGRWRVQGLSYQLANKVALGDLAGETFAIGSDGAASQPIAAQPATNVWKFNEVTGPISIPLQALSSAGSVSALPSVLQNAGFAVTSVGTSAIEFQGTYVFSDLKATTAYKDFMCQALACTPLALRALTSMDTDFLGKFTAIVTFRLPLVP